MADVKAFAEIVKSGDLAAVKTALRDDPSLLNTRNDAGQSPLLLAKYYRHPAIADYLLTLGPALDVFEASAAGLEEHVLRDIDADPEMLKRHSTDGWTPLHLAAYFGHKHLAESLLDRGAKADTRSNNAMTNTPLHAAVAGGHAGLVELLLRRGADPDARQHGGWTSLHGAAQSGNREMIEVLLAYGAKTNATADNNQTPLDLALTQGRTEAAELLEQLGARSK
jgi:ankyrin repeat protein